jgi:hypothetical protein
MREGECVWTAGEPWVVEDGDTEDGDTNDGVWRYFCTSDHPPRPGVQYTGCCRHDDGYPVGSTQR